MSAEKRLNSFAKSLNKNEKRRIEEFGANELNVIFSKFFMHAKKIDKKSAEKLGELYQPDSLSSFIHSWQRILSSRGSRFNIRSDKEFEPARRVLAARRKQLVKKGLGNKPCTTRPLTDNEIDKLYEVQYFGLLNPVALQRNVWWVLTISFGFRGRDEARKLLFGAVI